MRRKYSEGEGRRLGSSLRSVLGLAFLGLALLAAPIACARRAPKAGGEASPGQAQAAPAEQPAAKPNPAPVQAAKSAPAAEAARRPSRKVLSAATRAFGLGSPSLARLPEDFSLGPLQDRRAAGAEAEVLSVAARFLDGLEKGKLDESLLLPESREALALLLAPSEPGTSPEPPAAREPGPALPSRLGRIAFSADGASASLRVRLGGRAAEERLEGSLALGLAGTSWYVESLSLDEPAEGGPGPLSFDPSRRGSL